MSDRRQGRHAATMPKHTSAWDQTAAPTSEYVRSSTPTLISLGSLIKFTTAMLLPVSQGFSMQGNY